MAIGMSELKKGLKIEVEGIPYKIVEYRKTYCLDLSFLYMKDENLYEKIEACLLNVLCIKLLVGWNLKKIEVCLW